MHTCIYIYVYIYISIYIYSYTCFFLNFDALAQASDFRIEKRQVVFLCWMQDSNQGHWNRIANRLNGRWQTDWAIEDQAKNSIARSHDQRAFSPLDPTAGWIWHLALAIYMFIDVNFDARAQARDFRIEKRRAVFLCWMQDSNQGPWNRIQKTVRPLYICKLIYADAYVHVCMRMVSY